MNLFIAHQTQDAMHDEFVLAALLECMRFLPTDFFELESYEDFHEAMQAYLML
jgi:hypothetical protein